MPLFSLFSFLVFSFLVSFFCFCYGFVFVSFSVRGFG